VLLALVLMALLTFGNDESYEVRARFQSAGQLVNGNLVQLAGTKVGTIKSIELTPDGLAEVRLSIDSDHAPLRRGTEASLRTASLSGVANRYVDLQMPPGESRDVIEDGGIIPPEDTTTAVDLDQVFNLFNKPTRRGLRNVIRGFGATYEDQATEANAGFAHLNPSLVATRRLFDELTYDERSLQSFLVSNSKLVTDLVDRLATTMGAIGPDRSSRRSATSVSSLEFETRKDCSERSS